MPAKMSMGPLIGGVMAVDAVSTCKIAGDKRKAKVVGGTYIVEEVKVTAEVGVDCSGRSVGA